VDESWVERQIREAQEAGKLEMTEGVGQPIADLARPYDPAWWAKRWVAGERSRQRAADLARELDRAVPRLLAGTVIAEIQSGLESLNARIEAHNVRSPGNSLPLLDVEQLVNRRMRRD
jgi:hypothetical protein